MPALLRALAWALVTLLVAMLLAFLAVRHWVLPAISANPAWVLDPMQRALGVPVQVRQWEWSWSGLHPRLEANELVIASRDGAAPALTVRRIQGVLAWRSLLRLEPRFSQLKIDAPALQLRRLASGQWEVAGQVLDASGQGEAPVLQWLARQGQLQLSQGRLTLIDARREDAVQQVEAVQVQVRNEGRRHRFQLTARLPSELGESVALRGDFRRARFSRNDHAWGEWSGTLFAEAGEVVLPGLAAWLPVPLENATIHGTASLRAWADWQQGRWSSGQLDAHGEALAWVDGAGQALRIQTLQTRLNYAQADQHHYLTFPQLRLEPVQGAMFAPTQAALDWTADASGAPLALTVTLRDFLLESVQPLVEVLPLAPDGKRILQDMAPRGRVQQLTASANRHGEDWQPNALDLGFEQLALNPDKHDPKASGEEPGRPGGTQLRGTLQWTPRQSTVEIDAPGATLAFPSLFEDPLIQLDQLRGKAVIETPEDGPIRVRFDQVSLENADVAATAEGVWTQQGQSPSGTLRLTGAASRGLAQRVHRYLPLAVDADARRWVKEAVQSGRLAEAAFEVDGDLDRFPFAGSKEEVFRISSRLDAGRLVLVPPYLAEGAVWPNARNLNGTLVFDQDRILANVKQGQIGRDKTAWLPVEPTQVRIEDLEKEPLLTVKGVVAAEAAQVLRLVQNTSLNALTDEQLAESQGQGKVRIPLTLTIPLDEVEASKVQGRVVLKQNRFQYLAELPMVEQISGELSFDENGIQSEGVTGRFHGQPVTMRARREGGGNSRIELDGRISQAGLASWLPSPLWDQVTGETAYRVEIDATQHQPARVRVRSSLQGLGLDLPAPLQKKTESSLPLRVEWSMGEAPGQAERWTASLGTLAEGIWERHHGAPNQDRAVVSLGAPAVLSEPGLHFHAKGPSLDLDPWLALVGRLTGSGTGEEKVDAVAGPVAGDVADRLPPIKSVQLQTPQLRLDGQAWHGLDLHATYHEEAEGDSWSVSVSADEAEGILSWQTAQAFGRPARLFARLDRLRITEEMSKRDTEKATQGKMDGLVPEVDVVVKRFYYRDHHLGRLELQARHDAQQRAWQLQTVSLRNPEGVLEGKGVWRSSEDSGSRLPEMFLDAQYRLEDSGGTLKRFGFADAMEGGKGTISAQLRWNGLPYSLDLPSLSGKVDLQLDQGRFLKVEPGAAKLLNMLSLQALPRRVALDFSDVFSQGFAYDSIRGQVRIEGGVAHTDSFKMGGPSATVMMAGKADLHQETQDLRVVVIPQLDAGAASLLYGAVVNPAIGLGVFLAQWLMQNQLSSVLTYQYDVTGSWQEPNIVKVSRGAGPNAEEASP
ncbi:MAG: TIGR02099 family protein [Pigmentiphaga sp.]|nr:TIGR02099 family protein [Pigmentiphaga sp.]